MPCSCDGPRKTAAELHEVRFVTAGLFRAGRHGVCGPTKQNGASGPVSFLPCPAHQTVTGSLATIALPDLQLKACAK